MFSWKKVGDREYLAAKVKSCEASMSEADHPEPILFGFGGKDFFSLEEAEEMNKVLGCSKVFSLDQVHGTDIACATRVDSSSAVSVSKSADGWEIEVSKFSTSGALFALKTADCLPIIIQASTHIYLLHAGWRGLRDGIIGEALMRIRERKGVISRVWIGPAADPKLYEVGGEFVEYFEPSTLAPSTTSGKYLFNAYTEALRQFQDHPSDIFTSPHFTMSDDRFSSYRISGKAAGRNISFVAFPSS